MASITHQKSLEDDTLLAIAIPYPKCIAKVCLYFRMIVIRYPILARFPVSVNETDIIKLTVENVHVARKLEDIFVLATLILDA